MRIAMHFVTCSTLPKQGAAAAELVEILRSGGATILTSAYGFADQTPERKIESTGSIVAGIGVEHPLLGKGRFHHQKTRAPIRRFGTGDLSYLHENRQVILRQDLADKPAEWEQVTDALLDFGMFAYALLRPQIGWVDEQGRNVANGAVVRKLPHYLFWANFYSPQIVKLLGKGFLLDAPGWKKEELGDGGILYVVDAKYHRWHEKPSQQALRYFQTKIPHIRPYHAKAVELPDELERMVVTDEETGKETVVYERGKKPRAKRRKK